VRDAGRGRRNERRNQASSLHLNFKTSPEHEHGGLIGILDLALHVNPLSVLTLGSTRKSVISLRKDNLCEAIILLGVPRPQMLNRGSVGHPHQTDAYRLRGLARRSHVAVRRRGQSGPLLRCRDGSTARATSHAIFQYASLISSRLLIAIGLRRHRLVNVHTAIAATRLMAAMQKLSLQLPI